MKKLAFFYESPEVDCFSGTQDALSAWRYAAKAFGVDEIIVINLTKDDINFNDSAINCTVVNSIKEFIDTTKCIVYAAEVDKVLRDAGKVPVKLQHLNMWEHAGQDHCIFFGSAMALDYLPDHFKWFTVDTADKAALHSIHVAYAVLHHFYVTDV